MIGVEGFRLVHEADFNFPDWHYYGRGSGQERAYHRYELVRGGTPHSLEKVRQQLV